jgi:hypothetical protein
MVTRAACGLLLCAVLLVAGATARGAGPTRIYTYDVRGNLTRVRSVDTASDPANCGAAGRVCTSTPNGVATCTQGACGVRCSAGFAMCGGACAAVDASGKCPGTGLPAWMVPIIDLALASPTLAN